MKPLVIIFDKVHPILPETLISKGFDVIMDYSINYQKLVALIPSATGLIVTSKIYIDKKIIDAGIHLKWIARLGSGMDIIDVDYAKQKNIQLINSPEGNANAVAEHCVGLLLNLSKHISKSYNEVKNFNWLRAENRGFELQNKKIGIIGFGNTGAAFAKKLSGFEMQVYAFDKYKKNYGNNYVTETNIDFIVENCEIISLHIPLNSDTYHYANALFFNTFIQKPIFISTCRGAVTNLHDLNIALEKGLIKAAALDVLENESLPTYTDEEKQDLTRFLLKNNTIITPHIAGYTDESFYKISKIILKKLNLL